MQSILSVQPLDTAGMHLPDLGKDTRVKTEPSEDMTQSCKYQIEGKLIQTRHQAKRRLEAKDITFINLVSDKEMEVVTPTGCQTFEIGMTSFPQTEEGADDDNDDKAQAEDDGDNGDDITDGLLSRI